MIGAKGSGFLFKRRQHTRVTVEVQGEVKPRAYEVLHVCEFNSSRKRMSVVVRPRRLLTAIWATVSSPPVVDVCAAFALGVNFGHVTKSVARACSFSL